MDLNERGGVAELREAQEIADSQTKKLYKGYPETPDDWWVNFNEWYEPELLEIVSRYLVEADINTFKKAKEDKDPRVLVAVMNRAWFNASDSMCIHTFPGWGVMCDLCSESYLVELNEDQLKQMEKGEEITQTEDQLKQGKVELETKENWAQYI